MSREDALGRRPLKYSRIETWGSCWRTLGVLDPRQDETFCYFLYESKSERRNARNQKFTNSAINKASCFSDNRWFGRTNPFGDLEKWRRTPESIHSITGNGVLIVGHAFKWLLKFPWWKVSVIYYTAEDWGVWDEEPELQGREMILSWKRMGENYPVFEKQWNSWKALLKTLRMNFVTF